MTSNVAVVSRAECQGLLKEFQTLGVYDKNIKCFALDDQTIAIPLKINVKSELKEFLSGDHYRINDKVFLLEEVLTPAYQHKSSTFAKLDFAIKRLIKDKGQNIDELCREIPKKWEKYGDLVIFDGNLYFISSTWKTLMPELWVIICVTMNVTRIAVNFNIKSDKFRTPKIELVYGNSTWVDFIDNRIKYSWDIEKTMFCAGNAPERHRIATLNCKGEVVLDLYAGIGYFTLPYLVRTGASLVHACEWSPHAISALKHNLKQNNVFDKCVIHEGDNRLVCPIKIADRVNMGLLPSCRNAWKTACLALKPSGGVLHIHENVTSGLESSLTSIECFLKLLNQPHKTTVCKTCSSFVMKSLDFLDINSMNSFSIKSCSNTFHKVQNNTVNWKKIEWKFWSLHVCHSIAELLQDIYNENCSWNITVQHVYSVKSYGPHINHMVIDVLCTPLVNI